MKQYIKKVLWIIPFVFSLNLSAQTTYFFTGGNGDDASDLSLWQEPNFNTSPSNFTGPTTSANPDVFDFNGISATFYQDITIDNVYFSNGSSTAITVDADLGITLTILKDSSEESSNPLFRKQLAGKGAVTYDWSRANFSFESSSRQIVPSFLYNNLTLKNGQKTLDNITLIGDLDAQGGYEVYVKTSLYLKDTSTITAANNTLFIVNTIGSGPFLTDLRTSPTYPQTWRFITSGHNLNPGTYSKVEIYNNISVSLNLNTPETVVINDDLNLNHYISGASPTTFWFNIGQNTTLEINGTITNSSGSNSVALICTNETGILKLNGNYNYNLYIGHSVAANTNYFGSLILGNGTSTKDVTLYSDIFIHQNLTINKSILNLNGKKITFRKNSSLRTPSITMTGSGYTNANSTNSEISILYSISSSGPYTFSFPTNSLSNSIYKLSSEFKRGGIVTINQNLTIDNSLNFQNLNSITSGRNIIIDATNKSLIIGSVTYSSATNQSLGVFRLSNSTELTFNNGISTVYFDQSADANRTLRNFTITNGAICTIGNTLNITSGTNYGTVIIDTLATCSTGNNLILKSDANGSARIGKSSGSIVGEYTVEKYIPADRDYRFISSPVVNGTALQLRDNKGSTSGRGIQITGNNPSATTGNDFDASTLNNPSAYYYAQDSAGDVTTISKIAGATDDPGWRPFWNGNTFKLINGKGYRVFIRGDRSINLNQSGQPDNNTTIWTKGTYPGYSVNIPVQNSGRSKTNNGINLIGNPYPSVIDWNLIQKSNIDSGYMVYKNSNQSYVGWNGVTGSAGQYISAYQGFLVKCTNSSGSGSITVHERTKTVQTGGSFFQQKLTNHLKITMTYDSSYYSDAYLHFRNDAKNTYDGNDIQQMLNNGTNVATLDDAGMPYNINSMGTLDSFKSIPLSVEGTPAADLKLSFYDIASFSTHKLELIDNYLKKTTPIAEAMDYAFSITNDSWSYKNGRFFINLTKQETASNKIVQTEKLGILHPNPVKDKINISLEKNATNGKYQIVNSIGQEIMSGDIVGKSKTIDAKNLSTGIYYLNILSNGTSQNIKFIK